MKLAERIIRGNVHSLQVEEGRYIISRMKKPVLKIIYDPKFFSGSIVEVSPNIPEQKKQQLFNKALAWARQNIK